MAAGFVDDQHGSGDTGEAAMDLGESEVSADEGDLGVAGINCSRPGGGNADGSVIRVADI